MIEVLDLKRLDHILKYPGLGRARTCIYTISQGRAGHDAFGRPSRRSRSSPLPRFHAATTPCRRSRDPVEDPKLRCGSCGPRRYGLGSIRPGRKVYIHTYARAGYASTCGYQLAYAATCSRTPADFRRRLRAGSDTRRLTNSPVAVASQHRQADSSWRGARLAATTGSSSGATRGATSPRMTRTGKR